jgi:putative ABC transport system permease protein
MAFELITGNQPMVDHWSAGLPYVLVGQNLAKQLHLSIGEWFSANGIMLCCAGIAQGCQQASPVDVQQAIFAPSSVLAPLVAGTLQQLVIHVPPALSSDEVARHATELLAGERSLLVNATSMQVQVEAAKSILFTFVQVLRWVAFICMLVGGIGVANILLVSVRERRREIGVMQALGATGMQISGLFLCEALIYALTGGILGLLAGGVLVAAAGKSIGLLPVIKARDCTIVFSSAVLLGLSSGVAPAMAASRLKPVDALRDD